MHAARYKTPTELPILAIYQAATTESQTAHSLLTMSETVQSRSTDPDGLASEDYQDYVIDWDYHGFKGVEYAATQRMAKQKATGTEQSNASNITDSRTDEAETEREDENRNTVSDLVNNFVTQLRKDDIFTKYNATEQDLDLVHQAALDLSDTAEYSSIQIRNTVHERLGQILRVKLRHQLGMDD